MDYSVHCLYLNFRCVVFSLCNGTKTVHVKVNEMKTDFHTRCEAQRRTIKGTENSVISIQLCDAIKTPRVHTRGVRLVGYSKKKNKDLNQKQAITGVGENHAKKKRDPIVITSVFAFSSQVYISLFSSFIIVSLLLSLARLLARSRAFEFGAGDGVKGVGGWSLIMFLNSMHHWYK